MKHESDLKGKTDSKIENVNMWDSSNMNSLESIFDMLIHR